MAETFWGNMGLDGSSALQVPGAETRPYLALASDLFARTSPNVTDRTEQILSDAAKIFPVFDGVTNIALPQPADFADPSFESFLGWHTAHQVAYLKGSSTDAWTPGAVRTKTFGTSTLAAENQTFLLSADGKRVIHVNQLQLTDIARLSLADQMALSDLTTFRELFSNPLNLWPRDDIFNERTATVPIPPITVEEARTAALGLFDALEGQVLASAKYDATRRNEKITSSNLAELYPNLFLDQINLLKDRLANMAIFSKDAIGRIVNDLQERFVRLEAYSTVTPPVVDTRSNVSGLRFSNNSTDDLAGVNRALKVFLQSELRIRDIAMQSAEIVYTGQYNGRFVDAPQMVFLFQTQENYSAEAEAQAKSEELNQLNALMQSYTVIQKMLNTTMQSFDPVKFQDANRNDDKAVEKKGFMGVTSLAATTLDDEQKRVLSMFDKSYAAANNNTYLPIEIATNGLRPLSDILFPSPPPTQTLFTGLFQQKTQQEWDMISNNLSRVSKILSQEAQQRMDEVNRISRGKNRNYDLASETLNKMTDILRSIIN